MPSEGVKNAANAISHPEMDITMGDPTLSQPLLKLLPANEWDYVQKQQQ
jgi:hypothetical protein